MKLNQLRCMYSLSSWRRARRCPKYVEEFVNKVKLWCISWNKNWSLCMVYTLPLWGSSVPEHSVTRTLDRACVWKWPITDAMAPEVAWHYALWFFSLGICQRLGIRPTIATWPRWPTGTDHCSGEDYRCTYVDARVLRTWISYHVCRVTRGAHIEHL